MPANLKTLEYLKQHYPCGDNKDICEALGISIHILRRLVAKHRIHKSKEYLDRQHKKMMIAKEKMYLSSIPKIQLTRIEQNIIVGSLLGDGSLTYAPRGRNAYYREHFSLKQKEYREWKCNNIHSLQFRIEKRMSFEVAESSAFLGSLRSILYKQNQDNYQG